MIALKNKGEGGIDGYLLETKKRRWRVEGNYYAICQRGNVTVKESHAYVTTIKSHGKKHPEQTAPGIQPCSVDALFS